jgi:hypothetical protein
VRRFFFPAISTAFLIAACGHSEPPALPLGCASPAASASHTEELTGSVANADAKKYRMLPFTVLPGSNRIEVGYRWTDKPGPPGTPAAATTLDIGVWDERGYQVQSAFRGWGGSRQGRLDQDAAPIFIEAGSADRGFSPGAINAGTWYVDLGVAAVSAQGADYLVRVTQCNVAGSATPPSDPVDRFHVASAQPGWYFSDFHMHAFHSNPHAPDWPDFVQMARNARLDFLMVTEYVTGRHWETLGAVQRANPDLIIWPGREVITYFGHVMSHGETIGYYDYRHGFDDGSGFAVDIGDIQAATKAAGALFEINHPTIFPPPAFTSFCRGCYFELSDQVDWTQVDLVEVVNGPVRATAEDVGQSFPGQIENPFLTTALQFWDDHLKQGHKLTGVSGSDSKGVEPDDAERLRRGYGSSATGVFATSLTRAALTEAIKAGHVYIKALGVDGSPTVEFSADGPSGQHGIYGDMITAGTTETVALHTVVTDGANQTLTYVRNGSVVLEVPITSDSFTHDLPVTRDLAGEGPLGTYYRIETRNSQTRTTIGNPIFLKGP